MKLISILPSLIFFFLISVVSLQAYADNETNQPPQIIHINSADAEEISKALKGIGLKKAQAIIKYRENYGDFHHVDELTSVKGIGQNTLAKNIHLISLD